VNVDRQLAWGFGAALLATVLTALVANVALWTTVVQKDELAADFVERLALAERLRYQAERLVAASRGYLLTGDDGYNGRFEAANREFGANLAALDVEVHPVSLAEVRGAWRSYVEAARFAAEHRDQSSPTVDVLAYFEEVMQPAREELQRRIDGLVSSQRAALAAEARRSTVRARLAGAAAVLAALVALGVGAWLSAATRRQLAEQFGREHAAAVEARRAVAARDEVLAVVSHDLRGPLTAILLAAAQRHAADGALSRRLTKIELAARRMNVLIEDLLDAARPERQNVELHLERCDVRPLLLEACALLEDQAAQKSIHLSAQTGEGAVALIDRERIFRVLANLLGNAIKFTPEGGEVTARVDVEPQAVRVSVTDNGPGVEPAQLGSVFEKHFRVAGGHARGLGLGLYIARNLVEAHGGRIGAESTPGQGSTFSFTVPAAPGA